MNINRANPSVVVGAHTSTMATVFTNLEPIAVETSLGKEKNHVMWFGENIRLRDSQQQVMGWD